MGRQLFFFLVWMNIIINVPVFSQTRISSPYSRFALGDIHPASAARIQGAGNLCNAYRSNQTINFENPASYTAFDSLAFVFDGSIRSLYNQSSASSGKQNYSYASLNGLTFGIPITRWWKSSFGLVPYSSIGYKYAIQDTNYITNYYKTTIEGDGGLSKAYFGSGFKVGEVSAGINVAYLFGYLKNIQTTYFTSDNKFNIRQNDFLNVGDFIYTGGLQWQHNFKHYPDHLLKIDTSATFGKKSSVCWKRFMNDLIIVAGATATVETTLNTKEDFFIERILNDVSQSIEDTTYSFSKDFGAIRFPASYGAGLILKKNNKWMIGADYSITYWDDFLNSSIYSRNGLYDLYLVDSRSASVGLEFNIKKSQLRFGYRYEASHLKFDFKQIETFAFTAGIGIPLFRGTRNMLNVSLEAGKRGTERFDLIQEKFIRAVVAISIYERGFLKPKYY